MTPVEPQTVIPAKAGDQRLAGVKRRRSCRVRAWIPAFAGIASALGSAPLHADSNMPAAALSYTQLPDPRQEAAAKALMSDLRCLVCQGQSIADSDAELAGDMRALVRERIARGETPAEIKRWLVQRYGNWITYDPPLEPATLALWAMPLLLIAGGAWLARGRFRRHR